MTKRARLTVEEVQHQLQLLDNDDHFDEDCLDDPDEPIMDGSDEFSDLEGDECDAGDIDDDMDTHCMPSSPNDSQSTAQGVSSFSTQGASSSNTSATPSTTWSNHVKCLNLHPFTSPVGPNVDISSPLEVFLFFSPDLLEEIVQQSNDYAKIVMGTEKYDKWAKMTVEELKVFLGFSILMGINHLPSLNDYWSRDPRLRYAPVADRISRDRFRELSRYLHFVDNDTLIPRGCDGHDRLGKVRPLIISQPSSLKPTIQTVGWSSLKQYMPLKPTKHGIKVWVAADSTNSYFTRFEVYSGKTTL